MKLRYISFDLQIIKKMIEPMYSGYRMMDHIRMCQKNYRKLNSEGQTAFKNFRNQIVLERKLICGATILVDGGDGYMGTAFAMGKRLLWNMEQSLKS